MVKFKYLNMIGGRHDFFIGSFRKKADAREARDLALSLIYVGGKIEMERLTQAKATVATKYKLRTHTKKSKAKVTETDFTPNNKNLKAEILKVVKSKEGGMTEGGIMEEVRTNFGSGFIPKVFDNKIKDMVSDEVLIKEGDIIKVGDTKKKAKSNGKKKATKPQDELSLDELHEDHPLVKKHSDKPVDTMAI